MASRISLYAFTTPNGYRVSTYLSALGLPYDYVKVDITKGESKKPEFLKLNPNGRIPTLVDHATGVTISQTAAILQYLAETYDQARKWSYVPGTPEYWKLLEILTFSVGEQGPIQGQANHFKLYAQEKVPYGIERYVNDTKRIYGVLDDYLKLNEGKGPGFVGPHYSPADFEVWGWARSVGGLDIDINQWPHLAKWSTTFGELEGVKKGLELEGEKLYK